ncbi:PAS domain-containing protein [Zunongwangia sp. HGR-M22]|uniref:PAS domain-containing protein n=1 Tax=Zunongwangia sp. HGR-M22 TaxID=3015168 RepID=UPI0022DDCC51|nr:PAS domain S-box protein [Zunongwangia sp. HGR-M22]WBL26944.1 PAS domain S-box protein [Zunongwangia sp. HGR-M22]
MSALKKEPHNYISHCTSLDSLKRILIENCDFDILVLQLNYRESNLNKILDFVTHHKDFPVLIITNSKVRKYAYDSFARGIEDYMHIAEVTPSSLKRSIDFTIKRKYYKCKIERSENNYKTLFYASPLPMWVLDRQTLKFLSVNQAAINHYGYSEEEFLQKSASKIWDVDEEKKQLLIQKKRTSEFFKDTIGHRKKNGQLIRVNFHSTPIDFDGRAARLTIANDVTQNLKIKKALENSEERFKALVQEGGDLIAILDKNLKYKYVSPGSENILHFKLEDIEHQSFLNHVHPEDQPYITTLLQAVKKVPNKKTSFPFYRYFDGNGYCRFIETKATNLLDYGPVKGIVINSRDVTDLVEQRNRLSESLSNYEIVSEATSDIITEYDIRNETVKISKAIYKVCGYDPKEIEQNEFIDWWNENIHPEDRVQVNEKIQKAIVSGERKFQLEYRFKCANGFYKVFLDRSYIVFGSNGKPEKIIASKQDITQQIEHLKQIEKRNRKLEEIAWQQSHMVRAPLAKIMGLVQLIKHDKKNAVENEDLLEKLLNSADDLDAIVRKIAEKTYNN